MDQTIWAWKEKSICADHSCLFSEKVSFANWNLPMLVSCGIDGRVLASGEYINEEKTPRKTRLSTNLVLKDVFSEDRLKEYLRDVEKNARKTMVGKGLKGCQHDI